jgi:hypothetical protein
MKATKFLTILVFTLGLMVWPAKVTKAAPMGTAFTYQGRLYDANHVVDDFYDFEFKLYDDPNAGLPQGSPVHINEVDVIDGLFTVELDFGPGIFTGSALWLQIGVRPGQLEDPNIYTTLWPRQPVTPSPYAINADTLDGLDAPAFASGVHYHSGSDITSGTLNETRIDPAITRDIELNAALAGKADTVHTHDGSNITSGVVAASHVDNSIARDTEIMPTVLANDGPGSNLNADLFDGCGLDRLETICLRMAPLLPL